MQLGFNMAGTESVFEAMLDKAIIGAMHPCFLYQEFGVAKGDTFFSVIDKLMSVRLGKWAAVGNDILGAAYFVPSDFIKRIPSKCWYGIAKRDSTAIEVIVASTNPANIECLVNFALIDSCHCLDCVTKTFCGLEPLTKRGCIVAFHDACEEDQGGHIQPHSGRGIEVRKAIQELGLLSGERPGWKFLEEVRGDKNRQGNGFMFFERAI